MPLTLRHLKGYSGQLPNAVCGIPNASGAYTIAQVAGAAIVLGNECNTAPQNLLRSHDERITAFAISHGGGLAVSGQQGSNSDVVVWDLTTRAPRFKFQEHDHEVAAVAFSKDDRLLVTCGNQKDARLFVVDTATGKIVGKHPLEHGKRVTAAAWSPVLQGRAYTLASAAGEDITLWTIEPYTGMMSGQKVVNGSIRREYTCMAFSGNGAWLYGGTSSADVVTVNVARHSAQIVHPVCSSGVGAMLVSSDGASLVVGGRDGSLTTFQHESNWRELRPWATVPGAISALSLSADGAAFIVGTQQGGVYRLERSSLQLSTVSLAQLPQLTGAAFAAGQADAVATCSTDGSVCVWSLQDMTLQCRVQEGATAAGALCAVLTSSHIISGWGDGQVRCHARAGGGAAAQHMWSIPGAHALAHSRGVTAMALSNGGTFLLTGGAGGEVRVWDLRTREMAAHLKLHTQRICNVAVMADDAHVVACSEDRTWTLWDVASEKCRTSWRGQSMFKGLAAAPDKVSVVTVTLDRKVQLWDVRSPDPLRTQVEGHACEGSCVACDHGGATFATGGADNVVKVWDWRTGVELASAAVHTAPVVALSYSPDDRVLVSVAADGTMAVWDLTG